MSHERLLDALSTPTRGGIDGALAAPLMSLLLRGAPVEIEEVAARSGTSAEDVRRRLAAMPETEYDDHGRILGHVLTQVATPHRFGVCDRQLFTWCPLDTVIVPRLVGCTAHVSGLCGQTGERLHFISTPEGLHCLTHPSSVISVPQPDDVTHLRTAFCRHVRFFTSPEAAHAWLGPKSTCLTLPLDDAYALGATLADRLNATQRDLAKAV